MGSMIYLLVFRSPILKILWTRRPRWSSNPIGGCLSRMFRRRWKEDTWMGSILRGVSNSESDLLGKGWPIFEYYLWSSSFHVPTSWPLSFSVQTKLKKASSHNNFATCNLRDIQINNNVTRLMDRYILTFFLKFGKCWTLIKSWISSNQSRTFMSLIPRHPFKFCTCLQVSYQEFFLLFDKLSSKSSFLTNKTAQ